MVVEAQFCTGPWILHTQAPPPCHFHRAPIQILAYEIPPSLVLPTLSIPAGISGGPQMSELTPAMQ